MKTLRFYLAIILEQQALIDYWVINKLFRYLSVKKKFSV
jgi:hypothetical protein